jgi:hypothetical protein
MREQALAPAVSAQPWRIREQLDDFYAGRAQIGATLGAFIAEPLNSNRRHPRHKILN